MTTVRDAEGVACATVEHAHLTPHHRGLRVTWLEGATGVPGADAWYDFYARELGEAQNDGVRVLGTRLVTARADDAERLSARRSDAQREALVRLGFAPAESRVEWVMPIAEAIAALAPRVRERRLAWRSVDSVPGLELQGVAALLEHASQGDPDLDPGEDAFEMLMQRAHDVNAHQSADCVQVGTFEGRDVVVALPTYRPASGVGGLFYLAVSPHARGRGLATEALLHALVVLAAMGARTYHDGTAAANAPSRRLLAQLAPEPTLHLEQWRFTLAG